MAIPLRLLIIEDSPDDVELLLRELQHGGYDVTHQRVNTREEMRAALAHQPWDLVVSDHAMPTFSAPGALRLLREDGHAIPFIVVSGIAAEALPAMMMEIGADDYVLKSELSRLVPVIQHHLRDAKQRHSPPQG
jgi:DNA-binding response OmpR family regulator